MQPVRIGTREGRDAVTVLVRAWTVCREGCKLFVEGRMEDETGDVLATADGLFVQAREKL